MQVTLEQLLEASSVSKLRAAQFLPALNAAMAEFDINTPLRQAAFLAQVFHESGELQHVEENLNYSAEALRRVWPSRFKTDEIAKEYARNPQKIANKVYADRMGNGDEVSGDGWKFRGSGLMQLTGKDNHYACALALEVDLLTIGDYLRTVEGACRSAGYFWKSINGNSYADKGTDESFIQLTKRINGGTIGLAHRMELYKAFKRALGVK